MPQMSPPATVWAVGSNVMAVNSPFVPGFTGNTSITGATTSGTVGFNIGVVPGNRILLRGPNNPWLVACWLATLAERVPV